MSDSIKHECGIALIRLLKPLEFYREKYGTPLYGLQKLYMLMEKQVNRGQDGAGIATIKYDVKAGYRYISRARSTNATAVKEIFQNVFEKLNKAMLDPRADDITWLKENYGYVGELLLGHLRYGTFGINNIESCHPFLRQNNWMTRNLVMAGNFNLTNVDELFENLIELGQHPKERTDTVTMMEKIGHFLDEENQRLFEKYKAEGIENQEISLKIAENLDIPLFLQRATRYFDGGYTLCGLIGHGDAFVLRDPSGIRPAYYYHDDEIVVVTSERPPIMSVFNVGNVDPTDIKEIQPGHALVIKKNGSVSEHQILAPLEKKSCSFERIYFSRGNDPDIYQERKRLGYNLTDKILNAIDQDVNRTVFSYIPNTAETAFSGLIDGINVHLHQGALKKLIEEKENITEERIREILDYRPRIEKIANKDVKLRTFITNDSARHTMVNLVYDTTYGLIREFQDYLVVLDDSIVRGTTLKESIITLLDRLKPKRIIVASSAPQIRYPDCYGIDMSRFSEFIAWKALISLIQENGLEHKLKECYDACKISFLHPKSESKNEVKALYDLYTTDQITKRIAELITPENCDAEIVVVYQSIDGLHGAIPNHLGDWYFTGDYPTPGGNRTVNRAFTYWYDRISDRPY